MVGCDIPCLAGFRCRGIAWADRLDLWLYYMIEIRMVECDIPCPVGLGLEVRFRLTS